MGIQRNVDTGPLPVWCGGAFCDLAGFEAPKDVLLRGKPISDQTNMNGSPAKLWGTMMPAADVQQCVQLGWRWKREMRAFFHFMHWLDPKHVEIVHACLCHDKVGCARLGRQLQVTTWWSKDRIPATDTTCPAKFYIATTKEHKTSTRHLLSIPSPSITRYIHVAFLEPPAAQKRTQKVFGSQFASSKVAGQQRQRRR